jgi:hypothetical protein
MRKSFKEIDVGYSTEIDSSLFQLLENNDQYNYSKWVKSESEGLVGASLLTKDTSISFRNDSDMYADPTVIVETPEMDIKEDHLYKIGLQMRQFFVEDKTSGGAVYSTYLWFWVDPPTGSYSGSGQGLWTKTVLVNNGGLYFYSGLNWSSVWSSYPNGDVTGTFKLVCYPAPGDGNWQATISAIQDGSPLNLYVYDLGKKIG